MKTRCLLGIDIGTSSTKTAIIDINGRLISRAAKEYDFQIPNPGWAEQDPEIWFSAAVQTVRQAISSSDQSPDDIAGIGITGLMHGPVFLDSAHKIVRPSILWADQRSAAEVKDIYRAIGKDGAARLTGNPIATGFTLPTWLWLLKNEPKTIEKTHVLLLPKDYLRFRFTGEIGTEHSDASATLLYDPFNCQWSKEILLNFSLPEWVLPTISNSDLVAGHLRTEIAALTSLKPGTPVVFGGSDQACQAIGNGIIDPGIVSSTIGTGGQLFSSKTKPDHDPELRVHLFRHAAPHKWHLLAAILTAGKSLRWLRDQIFPSSTYQELADGAASIQPGAEGLFFFPYLVGERTPLMDPNATAAFVGLRLGHTREHIIRSVLEGVVMALNQGMEILENLNVAPEKILASGGAINHPLWLQLQADIFNKPIYQPKHSDAAALGAALLAGVGSGVYNNIVEACQTAVRWKEQIVEPNPYHSDFYQDHYQAYKNTYPLAKKR